MNTPTPYWIIRQLGISIGGLQLGESLERLAVVAYQHTEYYNSVRQPDEKNYQQTHFFEQRRSCGRREKRWFGEWAVPPSDARL